MTLLFELNNICFVDHNDYILKVFNEVLIDETEKSSLRLNNKLFSIKKTKSTSRKRKHDHDQFSSETHNVKHQYDISKQQICKYLQNKINLPLNLDTKIVCELSKQLFEITCFKHVGITGVNHLAKPIKCKIQDNYFYIPPNSRFLCGCVKEQCLNLFGNKFDLVIADPPWWNKYIRRLKSANNKLSYSMMYNDDIASIPVKDLLATNCLVAVWCTNGPSCVEAVMNTILPSWGVEYVTTWYWLKVTADLEPICDFSSGCRKQPYERLILGKVGKIKNIPKERVVISVPSALHSHKPPLIDLLKPYMNNKNPEVLELFARYLLPNTTSIGYEPLKWQHESLYEFFDNKNNVIQ